MDSVTGTFSSYSLDSGTYVLNVSAADTRFISYGTIEVKVVSITDEMMLESVGVRIGEINTEQFVSGHQEAFKRALLALSPDFRFVFNHISVCYQYNIYHTKNKNITTTQKYNHDIK